MSANTCTFTSVEDYAAFCVVLTRENIRFVGTYEGGDYVVRITGY